MTGRQPFTGCTLVHSVNECTLVHPVNECTLVHPVNGCTLIGAIRVFKTRLERKATLNRIDKKKYYVTVADIRDIYQELEKFYKK